MKEDTVLMYLAAVPLIYHRYALRYLIWAIAGLIMLVALLWWGPGHTAFVVMLGTITTMFAVLAFICGNPSYRLTKQEFIRYYGPPDWFVKKYLRDIL